jgi:hypothetical protein
MVRELEHSYIETRGEIELCIIADPVCICPVYIELVIWSLPGGQRGQTQQNRRLNLTCDVEGGA